MKQIQRENIKQGIYSCVDPEDLRIEGILQKAAGCEDTDLEDTKNAIEKTQLSCLCKVITTGDSQESLESMDKIKELDQVEKELEDEQWIYSRS